MRMGEPPSGSLMHETVTATALRFDRNDHKALMRRSHRRGMAALGVRGQLVGDSCRRPAAVESGREGEVAGHGLGGRADSAPQMSEASPSGAAASAMALPPVPPLTAGWDVAQLARGGDLPTLIQVGDIKTPTQVADECISNAIALASGHSLQKGGNLVLGGFRRLSAAGLFRGEGRSLSEA